MLKRLHIINIQKLIKILILTVLTMTPFFSFQESMALIFGGITGNSSAITSPYIKGIKDLFSMLIIFSAILLIIKKNRIFNIQLYLLFSISLLIILPAFYYHSIVPQQIKISYFTKYN